MGFGPEVLAARLALAESLHLAGTTAVRSDGGVPHTRQRPHSGGLPGARHAPEADTRAGDGRGMPAGRVSPEGHPEASGTGSIAIDTESDPHAGGGPNSPPPGYPDRPDSDDAATAVWLLVERAQAGDAAAFGQIYDRYFDTVFRFVYFRVGNRQLAEDLTADTFLRALKRIGSFTWQGRDLGAWLVTIARNLVADHFKSGRYRLEVTTGEVLDAERADSGPEGSPESAVVDHITNVALLKAVKQLNPEQQECIVLRFLQGFSVAETAQTMGKNEGAIKALQYRAVRTLARLLPDGFQP
ncbi:sigma-70 family RNA polymerase sigma factor [Planosporangium flavigriseum]|nr:sigma-70 family RNA polymerase sigma factor [Planosporangium flavigriseum]